MIFEIVKEQSMTKSRSKRMSGVQTHVQSMSTDPQHDTGASEQPIVEILDEQGSTAGAQEDSSQYGDEQYPVATKEMSGEEYAAQQEAESASRVARQKKATGPQRLNVNERKMVEYWLRTYFTEDSSEPLTKTILFAEMDKDAVPYFQPSMKQNVLARGVFKEVYDDNRSLVGAHLTESGHDMYARSMRVSKANNGEPTGRVARGVQTKHDGVRVNGQTKYTDNHRLHIKSGNPRQEGVQGYFSWKLYQEGMTYKEYMNRDDYDHSWTCKNGTEFKGPRRDHWDWDLDHGYIALYNADQSETLDDGSTNPNFWYINNPMGNKAKSPVDTQQPAEVMEQPAV